MAMKKNWYLIVIAALFLFMLCYFGTKRIISVNIWNKWKITTNFFNIENTIDLFDTTKVHEIKILMPDNEYKNMIDTYINTSKKDWYKANIIIDGVTIYDVGIRLKWEYSLKELLTQNWNKKNNFEQNKYESQLPILIKFDKYIEQNYQEHEMISLRIGLKGPDTTLLSEPYTYELYHALWQPAPDTSYGSVQINWKDLKLFIISELPEDKYFIQKRFWNDNWILYKAWNFVNFVYLWEDPSLYTDYFTQKTKVNDYDFAPLIKMLKFITESDNKEFKKNIDNYIDIESVITLLAIDTFVWNNDSFGGMWSNYYLYYHLWEQKFYIITWDQNLALWIAWWGLWWHPQWPMIQPELKNDKPISLKFTWEDIKEIGWLGKDWFNILKPRLLSNETFKTMYDDIYNKIEQVALDSDFSENFFKEWSNTFLIYNKNNQVIWEGAYEQWLLKLKNYLENMKRYRIQRDFNNKKIIPVND